jgi:hypothetical protein
MPINAINIQRRGKSTNVAGVMLTMRQLYTSSLVVHLNQESSLDLYGAASASTYLYEKNIQSCIRTNPIEATSRSTANNIVESK